MKTNPKTLVVDDSKAISNVMVLILNELGIDDITTAADGLKALELFKNSFLEGAPYGLIFLDLMMPVMDGQSTLKIMRAVEKHGGVAAKDGSVIIITTSRNSPNDMIDAIQGECTDYIVKPADIHTLRTILARYGVIN